ncbi:MAG TPA: hypothetical protein VGN82_12630 [Bosea sp. (in: a-proteobacteria)]|jgi:hypothetical protein|uniref:hypothetical protein n=1 Tax=Bosea sp. (in: a-proteobacteria) TaxID=1871050 RepID=UPI002E0E6E06|nr:hypothetical protein [Bosea sp. (in: a-proteobacteria)]
MADGGHRERDGQRTEAGVAMLLLQLAASQAEIGPFARRERETPAAAARLYRAAALRARIGGLRA